MSYSMSSRGFNYKAFEEKNLIFLSKFCKTTQTMDINSDFLFRCKKNPYAITSTYVFSLQGQCEYFQTLTPMRILNLLI